MSSENQNEVKELTCHWKRSGQKEVLEGIYGRKLSFLKV